MIELQLEELTELCKEYTLFLSEYLNLQEPESLASQIFLFEIADCGAYLFN